MEIKFEIGETWFGSIIESACESYISPSSKYIWSISGVYKDTIPNFFDCDSIITIDLTILNTSSLLNVSTCDSIYNSPSGKFKWTASGVYLDTITNTAGCDSIITFNLNFLNPSANTIIQSECKSYTSPSGKYTWTTTGIYHDTIPNHMGCDSIVTIDLKILNTSSFLDVSTCDSNFNSPSGKYIWKSSGVYLDTLTNTAGCDSIITINLSFSSSKTSTIFQTECEIYISPSGKYEWSASGVYKDTIPNAIGCDSIITILLIINSVDISVSQNSTVLIANATDAEFQWIDCSNNNTPISGETNSIFNAGIDGIYAVIVSQNGCVDTSACYSVNTTSLENNPLKGNITIYPNPNDGSFLINFGKEYPNVDITITEPDGRIIQKENYNNIQVIDTKLSAQPGLYLLIIKSENEIAVFKMIRN